MTFVAIQANELKLLVEVLSITVEKDPSDLDEMGQYAYLFTAKSGDDTYLAGASRSASVGGTFHVPAEFGELPKGGVAVPVKMLSLIKQATTVVNKDDILKLDYDEETKMLVVSNGDDENDDSQPLSSIIAPLGKVWPKGSFKKLLTKSEGEEPSGEELYTKDQLAPLQKVSAKLKEPITIYHSNPETTTRARVGDWHGWFLPDESNFDDIEEPDTPFILI